MDADLDTLCTVIYCTADDLLPSPRRNARRRITDAELVTLCVAQAIMGIPSDRRFLAAARRQLGHLFPVLPSQSGYHKRRRRLTGAIEWLMGVFAAQSPGSRDDLLLVDSTPVPCAQSRETVKRSALGEAAGYGHCAAHSRLYWGLRLHLLAAPDGTPRALALADPARGEREVALELLARTSAKPTPSSSATRATPDASSLRAPPRRASSWSVRGARTRPGGSAPRAHPPTHRVIFWTCKDLLTLERHGARTLAGLRERVLAASSASRPASASTTGWDGPAVRSSTTAPEATGVESII